MRTDSPRYQCPSARELRHLLRASSSVLSTSIKNGVKGSKVWGGCVGPAQGYVGRKRY